MSKTLNARASIGLCICMGLAIAACGIFMKTDEGLFNDKNFATTGVRNGNDLRGIWELDANSYSNPVNGGTQNANYNAQTRMRIEFKSPTDTMLRVTTYCESRDSKDNNKVNATYVNSEAWASIQNANQGGMAGATNNPAGQIFIQQFRNTSTSGEKNTSCVTPLQIGTYSFQVQEGRMYMNSVAPMNGTGNQGNLPNNGSYSFTKVRD